ncbi:MAG: YceI family protein [Acidobacteriota bacterium]
MKVTFYMEAALLFFSVGSARPESLAIDPVRSVMTIRVFRSGLFSGLAHDHEIEARGVEGQVTTTGNQQVSLRVDARKIKVLDPRLSPKDRAEVQETMEGPKVLDIDRFPEIRFQSTSVTQKAPTLWQVAGNLTLHGQSRPVTVEVAANGSRYTGQVTIRQRDFGIRPVSLFAGTVKVKNEVKIDFDIQTISAAPSAFAPAENGGSAE